MSDAIDGAEIMLLTVSLAYKESSNCRLEFNCEYICLVCFAPLRIQSEILARS